MKTYEGAEVKLQSFLTLALDAGEQSPSRCAHAAIHYTDHVLSESVKKIQMDTQGFSRRVSQLAIKINEIER
jgi:hypothetical protein